VERYDNHAVFRETSKVKPEFRKSVYFKLILLGILLFFYDLVFLVLYMHNNVSYSESIRAIMDRQARYQDSYRYLDDNLRDLSDYIDTGNTQELKKYHASREKLNTFISFLQEDDMGPYAFDMGEMIKSYKGFAEAAADAAKQKQQEEVLLYFNQAYDADYLISLYSNYTAEEIRVHTSMRLEELYGVMRRNLWILIVSFVVVTLFIICIVVHQIRYLLKPVGKLTEIVYDMSLEGWEITEPPEDRQDEMGVLTKAFYEMLNQIRRQYDELVYTEKLEKQLLVEKEKTSRTRAMFYRTRLQVFQSQINSHFLFNALNMVGRFAYMENAPQTRSAALLIASFLRSVLNQFNRIVTLSEELMRVQQYQEIQKLRFGDRIVLEIEEDPELEQLRIPAMVLQPLVENAYTHGVAGKEKGYIRCVSETEGKDALVYVWDDGGAMTEARRQELLGMLYLLQGHQEEDRRIADEAGRETGRDKTETEPDQPETDREHIGIRNVFERLYLMYGCKVQPMIESEEGYFTKTGFRFLDILDEEQDETAENNR
jgi:sensor histidine kinase YesM